MDSLFTVRAFYKFVALPDAADLRTVLLEKLTEFEMRGTILVAPEGINGTISGVPSSMRKFWDFLTSDSRFADLEFKDSQFEEQPFKRTKVKLKREIITMRAPEADPTLQVGEYVSATEWNDLISDPEVLVLDTRNDYEVVEGTFAGAVNPKTWSFGEFPAWVDQNLDPERHKRVAMFCTGGIRCEKASALLLAKGFDQVYHLKGGILKYLEEVPGEESKFEGSCFIFDDRDSLVTGLDAEKRKFDQNELPEEFQAEKRKALTPHPELPPDTTHRS